MGELQKDSRIGRIGRIGSILGKIDEDQKIQKIVRLSLLIGYVVFMAICVLNHESNRDEAQAWILAKNLSWSELYKMLRIEGHPITWFLILRLLAKLGYPFAALGLISLLVMGIAVYWLLYRIENVSIYLKAASIFSIIFFYHYAVITRPYCLCVLFIVLFVYYYPKRHKNPYPLAVCSMILIQLHVYMSPVGIAALLLLGWEYFHDHHRKDKRFLISCILIGFSIAFLIMELMQVGETHAGMTVSFSAIIKDMLFHPLHYFRRLHETWQENLWVFTTFNKTVRKVVSVLAILLGVGAVCMVKKIPKVTFVIAFSELMVFTAMIYIRSESGPGYMILMAYILLLAQQKKEGYPEAVKRKDRRSEKGQNGTSLSWDKVTEISFIGINILWVILCGLSFISAFKMAIRDLRGEVSGGKAMAAYINENLPQDSVILIENTEFEVGVIAYTDKNVTYYDTVLQEEFLCHSFGRESGTEKDLINALESVTIENRYIMVNAPLEEKELLEQCKLVYAQEYDVYYMGESFWLYEIESFGQ